MCLLRRLARLGGLLGILALIAWLDYLTGYELQFFLFYFVPVGLAAWFAGRAPGVAFALLSAAMWFWIERASGHSYAHAIYFYWNTLVRLTAFLTIALAISQIRVMLNAEIRLRQEIQKATGEVKHLRGLLPICASCKRIRNDAGLWEQIELYIKSHSEAEFTHGLCPDCVKKFYPGR
jgi:K+-sensing histidine kinase KdpD